MGHKQQGSSVEIKKSTAEPESLRGSACPCSRLFLLHGSAHLYSPWALFHSEIQNQAEFTEITSSTNVFCSPAASIPRWVTTRGIDVIIKVTERAAEFAEVEGVWQLKYKKDLHY